MTCIMFYKSSILLDLSQTQILAPTLGEVTGKKLVDRLGLQACLKLL